METLFRNFRWKSTDEIQSLLVRDGRVVWRGPAKEIEGVQVVDKSGERLYPPFIDNHCHILPTGLDLLKLSLERTESHQEVLELVNARHRAEPEGWLQAVHYDQNRYGGRHLSRHDLDKVSKTRPIMLRHSSGHAGVANTPALIEAKIALGAAESLREGFVRDESGVLNGVLLEKAYEQVAKAIPAPSRTQMTKAILAADRSMTEYGISCASDMQTGWFNLIDELHAYREAAQRGAKVAMRLYLQWGRVYGRKAPPKDELQELIDSLRETNCRVQGVKLFADGAIGAGTAAIYGSYADGGEARETSGSLIYSPEILTSRIKTAAEDGWQVSVHSIGDLASDAVMAAFEQTANPAAHRIEHAMILSEPQIERLSKINCHVCLQPEFLHRFGPTYIAKLGKDKAANLIRARSLLAAGLKVSFSSDRPVTSGSPKEGIRLSTHRPSGFNPEENCSLGQAMDSYTEKAAKVTGDEERFGSLRENSPAILNWVKHE